MTTEFHRSLGADKPGNRLKSLQLATPCGKEDLIQFAVVVNNFLKVFFADRRSPGFFSVSGRTQ